MSTAPVDEHPDTTSTGATGGHRFTLTGAADATGTSKRTILRHIDDLTRHGATKDDTGAWSIPLAALLAAGFKVGAPRTGDTGQPAPQRAPGNAPGRTPDDLDALRAELAAVRAELLDVQHRADLAAAERSAAIALATERAVHIDSLRTALRAIEAAPRPAPPAPDAVAALDAEPVQPRGWWRRLSGRPARVTAGTASPETTQVPGPSGCAPVAARRAARHRRTAPTPRTPRRGG